MTRRCLILACIVMSGGFTVLAQEPNIAIGYGPMNIEFMSGPIAFDTEPIAGAPYSAEAVTDVVQSLADGNRIVRQSKTQISRDSKGRTRREQGFAMFGPLVNAPGADEPRHVQISDPTTGTMVMLDLQRRTAERMPAPRFMLRNKIAGMNSTTSITTGNVERVERINVEKFEMAMPAPPPDAIGVEAGAHGAANVIFSRMRAAGGVPAAKPVVESLGTQFMEGIAVEGTRTTMTIPAGEIGNEQPIHIVSERWFSPDLKVLVMSRQSDPRFGDTTYRLTNLSRTEPPPQLFEIPADFTVVDPAGTRDMIIERKLARP